MYPPPSAYKIWYFLKKITWYLLHYVYLCVEMYNFHIDSLMIEVPLLTTLIYIHKSGNNFIFLIRHVYTIKLTRMHKENYVLKCTHSFTTQMHSFFTTSLEHHHIATALLTLIIGTPKNVLYKSSTFLIKSRKALSRDLNCGLNHQQLWRMHIDKIISSGTVSNYVQSVNIIERDKTLQGCKRGA